MNEITANIERVVRQVLAERGFLNAAGSGHKADGNGHRQGAASPAAVPAAPPAPLAPVPGDLSIDARVVTMTELGGRLDGVRRLLVARGVIVTPTVRDELLRRGILLACGEARNGQPTAALRVVLATMGTDFEPAALAAGLAREGAMVEPAAFDCIIKATEQLAAEAARSDTLGVLLTPHVAAGLCLANRLGGLRAVTGGDAPAVATAAAAVGANLLVVDPRVGTFFQLKQMVSEFCRGGVRPCPAVFRSRLA
jgi:hypothetical protein